MSEFPRPEGVEQNNMEAVETKSYELTADEKKEAYYAVLGAKNKLKDEMRQEKGFREDNPSMNFESLPDRTEEYDAKLKVLESLLEKLS